MLELLRYLEANGFGTCIASGGDRDFTRPLVLHDDDDREFGYTAGGRSRWTGPAARTGPSSA